VAQDLICFYGNDASPLTSSKLLFLFILSGGSNHLRGFSVMEKVLEMINEVLRKELNKIESRAELHEVYEYLKTVQNKIVIRASLEFSVGDKVSFETTKTHYARNGIVEGVVTKVNQKTIKVTSTTGIKWNVSANLLKKI
jgi:hypothetical protein